MRRWLLCCCLAIVATATAPVVTGPQVLSYRSDVDDTDQPYALYLPKDYDPSRRYPLVMSLHGAWSNHRLNLRRVFGLGALPGESEEAMGSRLPRLPDVDMIVASPLARGTIGYQGIGEKDVYDVLADVEKRFRVDEDRVYLTGLSMGGGGALWLALTRPDVWAAVAPVCPAAPPDSEELAGNALHLPVHLYQGELDPTVPVAGTRRWHKRLLDAGVAVEYTEYPRVRHNAWDFAYRNGAIFEWFRNYRRDRFPAQVRLAARQYRYGSAYWVRLDRIVPGQLATIDAQFRDRNRLDVATQGVDAFTLQLAGHPQYRADLPLALVIDGVPVRSSMKNTISLRRTAGGWRSMPFRRGPQEKGPGREGPIRDAVAGRQTYVFGSRSGFAEQELRESEARHAADWFAAKAKPQLAFVVKSDLDADAADWTTGNLVLMGTKETNRVIRRFDADMPLALDPSAADYGLVFIAPVNGHLALVNSGLPWWTGAAEAERYPWRFLPTPYRYLLPMPDFVLFRGSMEHIVAQGVFDQNFRVCTADAAALRATGVVQVR